MKMIKAIINPYKLDDVRAALTEIGCLGITATEVKGYGRQKGQREIYRGAEYEIAFTPKIMLETATTNEQVDNVVSTIIQHAKTDKIGAGKIFVYPIENAIRIRTAESGDSAL